jgi:hypothetical protein
MSVTYADFLSIYDFSLIEKAVQTLFVGVSGANFVAPKNDDDPLREKWTAGAGNIAFYTAFQALTFQKCRPRVWIGLKNVNHIRGAYAIDANGNLREKAWSGSMDFGIITEMNYTAHVALRAKVAAIIPTVLAQISQDGSTFATTGINALLANHQVSEFWMRNVDTNIGEDKEQAIYYSIIPCELAFNVKPSAWPAGMMTS